MKYMLLIYSDPAVTPVPGTPEQAEAHDHWVRYSQELAASGALLAGDALQGTDTATTVRVRGGDTLTTDGPFAETKEALGGLYIIECDDLDTALAAAAKIPGAKSGSVEVRPIMPMPQRVG
jgi:hypothetical protein